MVLAILVYLWFACCMVLSNRMGKKIGYLKGRQDILAAVSQYLWLFDSKFEQAKQNTQAGKITEDDMRFPAEVLKGLLDLLTNDDKINEYAAAANSRLKAEANRKEVVKNDVTGSFNQT